MEIREVYEKAIAKWGGQTQAIMAIQEMSELIKEITKHHIGKGNRTNLVEEMADVSIMVEQLMLIYNISVEELNIVKMQKQLRLWELLK